MAKAPRYHLDDPRMPVREAAGTILHALCDQAAAEAPGVLGGNDVKAVHDMRVALRRLRSAIETFGDWYEGGDFGRSNGPRGACASGSGPSGTRTSCSSAWTRS